MKKNFKLLILLLSLVALACFTFAACGKKEDTGETKETYTLVVNNDDSIASVSISPLFEKYNDGDLITLKFFAKDSSYDYSKISVKVNGSTFAVYDNEYSFNITENTVIDTIYAKKSEEPDRPDKPEKPESNFPLSSLKGRLRLTGEYAYDHSNDEYDKEFFIETVYGNNVISVTESDKNTGEVYYDYVYKKDNRTIKMVVRTIDNKIQEVPSDSLFKDYYNPFDLDLVTADDFTEEEKGVYSLKITESNTEKVNKIATAITGWNERIKEFLFTEENGVITKIHIVTEELYPIQGNTEDHYHSTYEFTLSEHGTADVDEAKLKPYPRTENHEILDTALKNAAAASGYAVHHHGHEVGYEEPEGGETRPGYGDTNYFVYSTEDMVYDAFKGEQHGFKVLASDSGTEYVYPFDYDEATGELTISDPVNTTIAELKADFTGFKVELFRYAGKDSNGLDEFILRENTTATYIAPCFALGNEKKQYSYATDFTIKLNNGVLDTVIFTYKTYGIEETVTLRYDFNAELDFPELDFANATKVSVFDDFVGQYKDEEGNFCEVTKGSFILNGETVTITSVDKSTGQIIFTCSWNGNIVYISKLSTKQLYVQIFSANETLIDVYKLDAVETQEVSIPEEMHGVWKIDNDAEDLHYEFTIHEHALWCNEEELPLISYKESEGLTVKYGSSTVYFYDVGKDDDGYFMSVLIIEEGGTYVRFTVNKEDKSAGIEIPTEYVGVYLSEDLTFKVVIEYGSIKINGMEFKPASFDKQNGFIGTYGEYADYGISFYSLFGVTDKDKLVVGRTNGDEYTVVVRTKSTKNDYIGTWTGTYEYELYDEEGKLIKDENGKVVTVKEDYLIVITDVSITVNGVDYPVKFNDEGYGYELHLPNNPYTVYILFRYNQYGNPIMVMYDDNVLLVLLTKKDVSKVDESLVGNWKSSDKYVRIYKDGNVSVKFNTQEFVKVTAEYDGTELSFSFKYMSVSYALSYNANADEMVLNGNGESVSLARYSDYTVPNKITGTWYSVGKDGTADGKASLYIEEDLITFVYNGNTYVIRNAKVSSSGSVVYFEFTVNGVSYSAEYGTYGEQLVIVEYGETTSFITFVSEAVN